MYIKHKHSCQVTYVNRSEPAFAADANTASEPIELPNNTEPSEANSFAKSENKNRKQSDQY